MLNIEEKTALYRCITRQFPDAGLYRASRVGEWLHTNGYLLNEMGYESFRGFAEDFPEMFDFQDDNNNEFIEIKKWAEGENKMYDISNHPADNFFGTANIILNDDIIEITQRSLYALTKILANGLSVQQMKQLVYEKFDEAKQENKLVFFGEKYTFPLGYCPDGLLVNGIITKNISSLGKSLYFSFDKTQIYRYSGEAEKRTMPFSAGIAHTGVPAQDKETIRNLLINNFECGKPVHMASISKFLTDHGINRMKYGYFKMKDLLAELDFLKLDEVTLGGVPQVMVTIASDGVPKAFEYVEPKIPIPAGKLSDFCNLPAKPMGILESFIMEKGFRTDHFKLIDELNEDFESARQAGKVRSFETKLIFPCRYLKDDGTNVELTLKPSAYEGRAWFLYYVDAVVREKSRTQISPKKQLESFAFLGSWSNFLSELAAKAVEEEWDFSDSPHRFQILIQYIKYTFSRLVRENKVCVSSDRHFAAFNTGLADNHYDDIYACFLPNDSGDTEWKFAGFCTAASGGLGKQLVDCFNPLPQPASYFKSTEDLYFDHTKQIHTDFEHIIITNINRLPLQFLYDQFFDNDEAKSIVEQIRNTTDKLLKKSLYEELKTLILNNSRLFVRIQNRLKDSIELAKKRVRWNYKTAIPSYFPKRDTMSLMLPLALMDEITPDVALVVELTRSGSYQGQTILTLSQAYIDARLVCRMTDDWLSPREIFDTEEDISSGDDDVGEID